MRRVLKVALLVVGLAVVMAPLTTTEQAVDSGFIPALVTRSQLYVMTLMAEFVILAVAWNLIGGLTGYALFGLVGFFGLGAYTSGFILVHAQTSPNVVPPQMVVLAILAGPVVPAVFALLIGLPLLRLKGHYFAVATLGVMVSVGEVLNNIDALGGGVGLVVPIFYQADLKFFYLMVGGAGLAFLITWLVMRSRFGYGLVAIRESEEAAAVIGINTTLYKVAIFGIAAALAGLAGAIWAPWQTNVNQGTVFDTYPNVLLIMMALIGGAGTLLGPVMGAVGMEAVLQGVAGGGGHDWNLFGLLIQAKYVPFITQIGVGVLIIVTVIIAPRGIIDFFGGSSRLSLKALRQSLRETGA